MNWDAILTIALGVLGIVLAIGTGVGIIAGVYKLVEFIGDEIAYKNRYEAENERLENKVCDLEAAKSRLEDELAMYRVRTFRLTLRLKDATGVTYTGDESLATEEPTMNGGTICR